MTINEFIIILGQTGSSLRRSGPVFIALLIFFLISLLPADAATYRASLAQLPVAAENKGRGVLIDLVRLWADATGNTIGIDLYPFKRSVYNVIGGKADFHVPLIKTPHQPHERLDYDYSSSVIFRVNFVLYTNRQRELDLGRLEKYRIFTESGHTGLFDFDTQADYGIENALKKLAVGRIDGYIFADVEVDPILMELGFKNIKRQLYRVYDVHAVLPKGGKGNAVDRMISQAMAILRQNGKWDELMNPIYRDYVDWQP